MGHGHRNEIYPRPAPQGLEVWHGYWELQTSGLLDWPQQMRFLEIVDFGDGTGAIYSTMVNLHIPAGDVAEAGRFYALVHVQEGEKSNDGMGVNGDAQTCGEGNDGCLDRNVILRVAWPPDMLDTLASLPPRPVETLNFIAGRRTRD